MSTLTGRSSLFLLVLALAAAPAFAQRGFSLSPSVYATSLAVDGLDNPESEQGVGLSLRAGIGVSKTVTLYASASGARVESDGEVIRAAREIPAADFGPVDDQYTLGSFELGAQFNLLPSGAVNPFLRTGLRGTGVILDVRGTDDEDDPQLRGGGLTLGAGAEVRLSPKLALEASLEGTGGRFSEFEMDDVVYRNFEDIEFAEGRIGVGLVWRPNARSHRRRGIFRH